MLNCIFIKKKLYDYQDKSLNEKGNLKINAHLERCPDCAKILRGIQDVLKTAENKTLPQPSEDFWQHFKAGLDTKLNEKLVGPRSLSLSRKYLLKPVLVPSLIAVILFLSSYWYFNRGKAASSVDSALVNEVALWEEVSPETTMVNGDIFDLDDLANFDAN